MDGAGCGVKLRDSAGRGRVAFEGSESAMVVRAYRWLGQVDGRTQVDVEMWGRGGWGSDERARAETQTGGAEPGCRESFVAGEGRAKAKQKASLALFLTDF